MPETSSGGEARKPLPLCPGYSAVAGAAETPKVTFDGMRLVSIEAGAARVANPELHTSVGSWALMAIIERNGMPVAVLEQIALQTGDIVFVGPAGVRRRAPKSLEPTS